MNKKYFVPSVKSEKMGADSYYLQLLDLLEKVKKDKNYSQSIDIIHQIRKMQYLFLKHKKKMHIVQWKKYMHDFNANVGHYWFFSRWEDLRDKYLRLSKQKIDDLIDFLNIDI